LRARLANRYALRQRFMNGVSFMTPEDRNKVVAAFIEHNTRKFVWDSDMVLREEKGKDNHWAFEELYEASHKKPDLCWELILQILHTPHPESVTEVLAAGPLEDLLVHFGSQVIVRVEETARRDPLFKDLLGGVWKSSISSEIWKRVEACRGESW
jgi:hypothetical protein